MSLAKSTIQGEKKMCSDLSKEKEDLEAEVKMKLDILLENFEKGKQEPKCMCHPTPSKYLGTVLKKLGNPNENNSKKNITLLTILKNLCYECLHVRYSDVQNNSKATKLAPTKMRPIKPKGSEPVHHTLYEYGFLAPPSETNKTDLDTATVIDTLLDAGTIMKKNCFLSDTDITIVNTTPNSASLTSTTNKSSVVNKNLFFGNRTTHNDVLSSSSTRVPVGSGKITTPYPVINVDAALNEENDNIKCVNEEESEERQKFKDIFFYDQAESGINIDDVL